MHLLAVGKERLEEAEVKLGKAEEVAGKPEAQTDGCGDG